MASVQIAFALYLFLSDAVSLVPMQFCQPDPLVEINLASLGNQVPHLHWHVIARFANDAHYPDPIWGVRKRDGVPRGLDVATLTTSVARCMRAAGLVSD